MANEEVPVLNPPPRRSPRWRGIRLTWRVRDAAAEFFEKFYLRLLAFAMYMGATKEEAEDAIKSAMIDMLDRWDTIRDPLAYARTAIAHELIKQRTRARRLVPFPDGDGEYPGGRDHDWAEEQKLTVWADAQWVRRLLNSLPPRQQEVMALVVDGFKPSEVAVLLGRDAAAVRQNLMAARRRLKTALREQRGQGGRRERLMRTMDEDIMPAPDGGEEFPAELFTSEPGPAGEAVSRPADESLAELFTDVFELVDETVAQVGPGEVRRAVRETLPVSREGGRRPGGSPGVQRFMRGAVVAAMAGAWLAAFTAAGSVQLARFLLLVLATLAAAVAVTTWPLRGRRRLWPRKFTERPWRDGRAVFNIALRHMRDVFVVTHGKIPLAPCSVELQMSPRDLASLVSRIEIELVNSIATEHYQATIAASAARVVNGSSVKVSVTADPALPPGRYHLRRDPRADVRPTDRPLFRGHDELTRELVRSALVSTDLTLPASSNPDSNPPLRLVTNGSVAETRISGARAGRGEQVELQLPEENTVSRVHAEFICDGRQWRVIGKGRNGLVLNGAPVTGEQVVKPGDEIRWGRQDGALVSRVEIGAGQGL